MVNCYIRGLHLLVRQFFREGNSHLSINECADIILFQGKGKAIGNSRCNLLHTLASSKVPPCSPKQGARTHKNVALRPPLVLAPGSLILTTRSTSADTLANHSHIYQEDSYRAPTSTEPTGSNTSSSNRSVLHTPDGTMTCEHSRSQL